ncbi:RecX family transcriptional regulator [Aureimonas sp. SA4125]|uniref:regulatory protein RecX n=1 Tax=Aureimonas sp. SA4125 TaxID=2826993 RepID=UPI001CC33D1B|nr:RecX family transcriptional regulator [Aureimonas sp. SA4125]
MSRPPPPAPPQRRPRPVTPEWLFRAAAHYLGRYASTAENLRRVLERKVARRVAEAEEGGAPSSADCRAMIDATLARFHDLKLLDDRAFAAAKLSSLRRGGASLRKIEAKLSEKGVDRDTIAVTLQGDESTDHEAAFAYARRRRLGPHRLRDRAERRERDMAAMMRAGFGYGDARAAIDADGAADSPDEV